VLHHPSLLIFWKFKKLQDKNMSDIEGTCNSLEARLSKLEKLVEFDHSYPVINSESQLDEILRNYQIKVLEKLKLIRETLVTEGGDLATIRAERDAAVAENAALKKENERLQYRVRHLIKALDQEESKNKPN
jgi:hypothetical protein